MSESNFFEISSSIYFNSVDKNSKYSNSWVEPDDTYKNRISSFCVSLPQPSAIFVGIETTARLIWEIKLNYSALGNFEVME